MAALALAGLIGAGLGATATSLLGKQKTSAGSAVATNPAGPVVDPQAKAANNAGNLGRAALIMTSPQGVTGTDPVGRYKLLGNP